MAVRSRRKVKIIRQKKKSIPKVRKVRLAIECSPEERKYMKMFAAHEDLTLNEFVLECVRMRLHKCPRPHIPNKETKAALEASERGQGLTYYDSIEDFFKAMER